MVKMAKTKKMKTISFQIAEQEYKRVEDVITKVKNAYEKQGKKFVEPKHIFYLTAFLDGVDSIANRFSDKNACEKCGKRLPISVPRHLRSRLDMCTCKG